MTEYRFNENIFSELTKHNSFSDVIKNGFRFNDLTEYSFVENRFNELAKRNSFNDVIKNGFSDFTEYNLIDLTEYRFIDLTGKKIQIQSRKIQLQILEKRSRSRFNTDSLK